MSGALWRTRPFRGSRDPVQSLLVLVVASLAVGGFPDFLVGAFFAFLKVGGGLYNGVGLLLPGFFAAFWWLGFGQILDAFEELFFVLGGCFLTGSLGQKLSAVGGESRLHYILDAGCFRRESRSVEANETNHTESESPGNQSALADHARIP